MPPPDASADASGSPADDEDAYVPYARRPEWADVTPMAQPETARPVVAIDYRPEYVDAHDTFRAVRASGEVSRRALDLTAECLKMNGANYTVWHRRWELVEALAALEAKEETRRSPRVGEDGPPSLVDLELAYATNMALENPKNYQVWNHMRLVSQHLGDVSVERNVRATGEALALDAKNIHAWTHRLWVVRTFPKMMRDAERAFTEKMIDDDVRNNSAWNQRFAVTFLTSSSDDDVIDEDTEDIVSKELAFAETKIAIAPDNESAWNYLRGVADLPAARDDDAIKTRLKNVARTFCGDAISEQSDDSEEKDGVVQGVDATAPSKRRVARDTRATTRTTSTGTKKESREKNFSRHATALLADVLAASGAREDAAALYGRLVHRDPIRANYWTFMRDDARRRRG